MEQAFTAEVLCTVKLSRRLFPAERRHSLDAVIARHQIRCHARHRALGDARVLWDFWKILRDAKPRDLARATAALIGASRQAARGGDLGILLTKPRRAAAPPAAVTIRWAGQAAAEAPANLSLVPLVELNCDDFDRCYGVFGSIKSAEKALREIAKARQLCVKTLGFEPGPGSCMAYQLAQCRGACVGKEPASLHAMRAQLALSPHKLKSWPFPERIAIRQLSDGIGREGTQLHVLDRWRYLGTASSDEELAELSQRLAPKGLDPEIYRLLARYLGRAKKIDWIDLARDFTARDNFDV
jgi:hypothetical protein